MKLRTYEHRSLVHAPVQSVMAFHTQPGALRRLTPPPLFVQVLRDERDNLTAGELEFVLWFGPFPVRWVARHFPGPIETSFEDHMIHGPLAVWKHQHRFLPRQNKTLLVDKITLAHKPGLLGFLTRLFFDGPALRLLFAYRHWRTRRDVERFARNRAESPPATIRLPMAYLQVDDLEE